MSNGIEQLIGKTLANIDAGDEEIIFACDNGEQYKMHHYQDCCESVMVEDVCGDWKDLIGTPIISAVESESCGDTEWGTDTWTFYHISTIKGTVTIRWYGESNGYYSESVSFEQIKDNNNGITE